ncbi:hypothetical protein GCM10027259_37610 [Micromonospora palomenae]
MRAGIPPGLTLRFTVRAGGPPRSAMYNDPAPPAIPPPAGPGHPTPQARPDIRVATTELNPDIRDRTGRPGDHLSPGACRRQPTPRAQAACCRGRSAAIGVLAAIGPADHPEIGPHTGPVHRPGSKDDQILEGPERR